jgi:hypothetical protein
MAAARITGNETTPGCVVGSELLDIGRAPERSAQG